jgi:hypothetical protein
MLARKPDIGPNGPRIEGDLALKFKTRILAYTDIEVADAKGYRY